MFKKGLPGFRGSATVRKKREEQKRVGGQRERENGAPFEREDLAVKEVKKKEN